ncbi:MAG TPA: formate transporter FocA [Chitinophagales bacterium]|nr:formate transporter FocA [Chitinophagales bacterium]HRK27029.1 formate transporter FocA [Chitinophagales bacterium]
MENELIKIDALLPPDMAKKAEAVGVAKANMNALKTFTLSVLAGSFIALGAVFFTTVTASAGVPYGILRLVGGLVFSLGLVLVIVGGAELFTGNNLIIMAWASGKVKTKAVLKNWALVYAGNLAGALAMAVMVFISGQYRFGGGAIGVNMLQIANAKSSLAFTDALMLGILCNILVCLAVWLSFSARTITEKVAVIVFPISAFVAAGFEHSIANMYFIPIGMLVKWYAPAAFWELAGTTPAVYEQITQLGFLWHNLLPVTIGNIIGGAGLVGLVYWFVYLRPTAK